MMMPLLKFTVWYQSFSPSPIYFLLDRLGYVAEAITCSRRRQAMIYVLTVH